MKKIMLICAALVFAMSCHEGHNHGHEGHSHEEHAHSHENHDEHSHEGHSHSHEGHSHGSHDEHEGENGEIVFGHEQAEAAGLATEIASRGTFRSGFKVSGRIMPSNSATALVSAGSCGILHLEEGIVEGVKLRKGQKIGQISYEGLEGGNLYEEARAEFHAKQSTFKRARQLVEDQIISRQEFEQARLEFKIAQTRWEAFRNGAAEGMPVLSPMDGYITGLSASNGSYVAAGDAIASLCADRSLMLRAEIPANRASEIDKISSGTFRPEGSSATFDLDSLSGKVLARGGALSEGSWYLPVTFSLKRCAGLIPGSYADIYLRTARRDGVMTLPVSALCEEQGIFSVFVRLDEECWKKQEVKTGGSDGVRCEIISGIHEGDEVAVSGVMQIKLAGMKNAVPGHTHNH